MSSCNFYWGSHGCDKRKGHFGSHLCGPGGMVYDEGELREDNEPCSRFKITSKPVPDPRMPDKWKDVKGMVRYFQSDGTWSAWMASQGFWMEHPPFTVSDRLRVLRRRVCLRLGHPKADWSPVVFSMTDENGRIEQIAWRCAVHDRR